MHLSRSRILLRVVLLTIGGAYMLWRAWGFRGDAARGAGALGSSVALVWALVGVLALGTAASTAWSLRRRPRHHTLHLDDVARANRGHAADGEPKPPRGDQ